MPAAWDNAPKDPDAVRDYSMDWSGDLGTATITSSTWEVVDGNVTIVQDNFTTTATVARLAGGTAGETCHLKNHVVLSDGEEDEFTGALVIAER